MAKIIKNKLANKLTNDITLSDAKDEKGDNILIESSKLDINEIDEIF